MMKVFLSLALFVWAFYSYAECYKVQSPIHSQTKLYQKVNLGTSRIISPITERTGNIEKVFISEKCTNNFTVRYQTAAKNLRTNKLSPKKYYCMAKLTNDYAKVLSSKCLVNSNETSNSYSGYNNDEPTAYPYDDADDPFSSNNNNYGPRYGEEPEYPGRTGDGPDSYGGVLF